MVFFTLSNKSAQKQQHVVGPTSNIENDENNSKLGNTTVLPSGRDVKLCFISLELCID